jgi:peptide chain release factor 2
LRTHAPGFWDDAKAAEAQMRKIKELKNWVEGYKGVKTAIEELQLAYENLNLMLTLMRWKLKVVLL